MKNLIIGLLFLAIMPAYSQALRAGNTYKVNGNSYTVKSTEYPNRMTVTNLENKYTKSGFPQPSKGHNAKGILRSEMHVDHEKVNAVVKGVLKDKLSQMRTNKEKVSIYVTVLQNGSFDEFLFMTANSNTLITPQDIDQIIKKMKQEVRMTFSGSAYKDHSVINYNFPFFF